MKKISLPESIDKKMRLWRMDLCCMPEEYIEFHANLAKPTLDALVAEHRLKVHRTYMESDGWLDGMRALHAIVEEKSGRLVKLSWHDGNQEFFEHYDKGGGSGPYRLRSTRGEKNS